MRKYLKINVIYFVFLNINTYICVGFRTEPRPDKIGYKFMAPFYTIRISDLSAIICADVDAVGDQAWKLVHDFNNGTRPAAVRVQLARLEKELQRISKNWVLLARASANCSGCSYDDFYNTFGAAYIDNLRNVNAAFSFFGL